MSTLTYTGTLDIVSCFCGIKFGIPQSLYNEHRRVGTHVYCPLGHCVKFGEITEQAEIARLKRRLDDEQARVRYARDDAEHQRRRLAATKGVLTKTKKRVANGVCPCCQRTFVALGRHMASQHPQYVAAATE